MKCLVVNSVASNHVQHVSTNTFHLDANSGNSSQHDPLIELEMPAYSGSSREITGHFLMELTLSSHLCLDHSRGRTQKYQSAFLLLDVRNLSAGAIWNFNP